MPFPHLSASANQLLRVLRRKRHKQVWVGGRWRPLSPTTIVRKASMASGQVQSRIGFGAVQQRVADRKADSFEASQPLGSSKQRFSRRISSSLLEHCGTLRRCSPTHFIPVAHVAPIDRSSANQYSACSRLIVGSLQTASKKSSNSMSFGARSERCSVAVPSVGPCRR